METSEQALEARPQISVRLIDAIPGALITAVITLLFFSLYWNRFAGLRSGNGSFQGGMALLRGVLPYRDFFTAGPPLNEIISAAVLKMFGQELIVIRAWGVFERVALALLLYFWLVRLFSPKHASMASVVAIIASAGDPSNALSSYGMEAIFFFLLSGFASTIAFERGRPGVSFGAWAAGAGLCAALSLSTKQTLGAGATVGIPVLALIYLLRTGRIRRAISFVIAFAAGWGLGVGAVLFWLADVGVVHAFLDDAFKKGPSAKASHASDFVIRAARAAWGVRWGFLSACVGLIVSWPALRKAGSADRQRAASPNVVSVAVLSSIAIAIGAAASYSGHWLLPGFDSFTIFFGFFGTILLLLYYAWRLLRGDLSERELEVGFLAGISFGIALMVSLSWPASFDMVIPAFGLMTALVLSGSNGVLKNVTYGICALVALSMTCEKLNRPHGFHEWTAPPVRITNSKSSLPELKGLLLSSDTVRFVDGTARIIQVHSKSDDTIFVYPEFGIFYTLTKRKFPTTTDSHNIDVVNDEFARSEAQRVLHAKPAVVIYFPTPAWSLRADERLWRNGQRSGQRDLIAAVEQLTSTYSLAATFKVPPNDPVKVYVRR